MEDSDVDPVVEAILAAPDDDAPRRVWADRLLDRGEPWGELVHVQCDLAAGGLSREEAIARRRRERELIDAHGERWAEALADFADRWIFRRGMIDEVHVSPDAFAEHADELFAIAPLLRRIDFGDVRESVFDHSDADDALAPVFDHLARALASPHMAQIEALGFGVYVTAPWYPDERPIYLSGPGLPRERVPIARPAPHVALEADGLPVVLAASTNLSRIRMLSTRARLTALSMRALAASPLLPQLEHLQVRADSSVVRALFDRLAPGQIQSLCIDGGALGGEIASVLSHPALALEELRMAGTTLHYPAWENAMQLPQLASLRRLMIHGEATGSVVLAIGDSPALAKLVELDLSGVLTGGHLGYPPIDEATRLDSVRVLRLQGREHLHHAHRLFDMPIARRLEVLDLRRSGLPTAELVARANAYDGLALCDGSIHTDLRGWTEDAADHPRE